MKEYTSYNEIKKNIIQVMRDENDFEVRLNGVPVLTTGSEFEAELVAESLHVALIILNTQEKI